MKICYITNGNINSTAAFVVNISSMCDAFAREGHDVHLITPFYQEGDFDKEEFFKTMGMNPTFTIHRVRIRDVKFFRTFFFILQASRYANRLKPELFFVRYVLDYLFVPLLKGKVIIESHSPPLTGRLKNWLQKRNLKSNKVQKLVLITEALKSLHIPLGNEIINKTVVAADAANIPGSGSHTSNFKINGPNEFNIGYVGHLYKGRGIELIHQLSEKFKTIDFHILGGSADDVDEWKNITKANDNMHFYGHAAHSDIPAFASKMDVLLSPYQRSVSVKGGGNTVQWMSPLKIFEYMSYEKPFICSDLPVLREVLKDSYNCILCSPDKSIEWENAIEELRNNAELRNRLGANALADLKKNYTWSGRINKIMSPLS